ncbi:hypothetical protein BUE80_DR001166 [Diplocarpon rosae]|nr:hypothetical protein BUE80_DR001166 [Diplocarpon rosae]
MTSTNQNLITVSGTFRETLTELSARKNIEARFRRCDNRPSPGTIFGAFGVSADILLQSSETICKAYRDNDWDNDIEVFIDVELSTHGPMEIFLRALQEVLRSEDFSCPFDDVKSMIGLLRRFGVELRRFEYWFSMWFAKKHILHMNRNDLQPLLDLCAQFNHGFGIAYLPKLITHQHVPKCILAFPPVPIESFRQNSAAIILERAIKPSQFKSNGFSDNFKLQYGEPTEYWTDFLRRMEFSTSTEVFPKYKNWEALEHIQYLSMAKSVDSKVNKRDRSTVWRDEMDAAWIQKAVVMYEAEVGRLGNSFSSNKAVREKLQKSLKKIIHRRFHPSQKIEAYWEKKRIMFNGSASQSEKKVGTDEPPLEMVFAMPETQAEEDISINFSVLENMMNNLLVSSGDKENAITAKEALLQVREELRSER